VAYGDLLKEKMSYYFPPKPRYPKDYDNDHTLYLVFDTSETTTSKENLAWSTTVEINPVGENEAEIWAENGYANIEGELFYYSKVEKNEYGKIIKFKNCIRNLGGEKTKYTNKGAEVRGYVVAEHHNQLVDAIINIEKFVGEDFSEDKKTLDWRIRNLNSIPVIFDDFSCPDVTFTLRTVSTDPATGTIVQYDIAIEGQYTSFRLDFGDGDFTTTQTSGTKTYSVNSKIDPVVSVANSRCSIIQTPIIREEGSEPQSGEEEEVFTIRIPTLPDIPNIVFPNIPVPSIPFTLPPIVQPCLGSVGSTNISVPSIINIVPPIPSLITITDIDIPSVIVFVDPPEIPSVIVFVDPPEIPSIITFIDLPEIPSVITFGEVDIPTVINFGAFPAAPTINIGPFPAPPTITGTINFGAPPTIPDVNFGSPPDITVEFGSPPDVMVDFGSPPEIRVAWGNVPTLECTVTVVCDGGGGGGAFAPLSTDPFDSSEESASLKANYNTNFTIPSEIKVVMPNDMPNIIVAHDIPATISITAPKFDDIKVVDDLPEFIELRDSLPKTIFLEGKNIPEFIDLRVPDNFPSIIKIDASDIPSVINVVGIPPVIEIKGMPSYLELKMPENPQVEMVYKGSPVPIDLKIHLDISEAMSNSPNKNCVAIVPCN
jgi:hypothetical protein